MGIDQAKEAIAMRDALLRLTKNRDFKKLITEFYFEKEPVRLVMLKADPAADSEKEQANILAEIDAISRFRHFLRMVMTAGNTSERAMGDYEDTLSELNELDQNEDEGTV